MAFSKWPLSVSSFLDTRTLYYTSLQRSTEFSSCSRKICSVPLNCSAKKMGQTIFYLAETAEGDTVVITEHTSSISLHRIPPFYYEKPSIFVRKAPGSPQPFAQGPQPQRQAHAVFVNLLHHASLQSFYCVAVVPIVKPCKWADTLWEVLAAWRHLKTVLFPFLFLSNHRPASSLGAAGAQAAGSTQLPNLGSALCSSWDAFYHQE